jgi:hypothetical protein
VHPARPFRADDARPDNRRAFLLRLKVLHHQHKKHSRQDEQQEQDDTRPALMAGQSGIGDPDLAELFPQVIFVVHGFS